MSSYQSSNPGICVLYHREDVAAERMSLVEPIVRQYLKDNGIQTQETPFYFLEISSPADRKPERDRRRLEEQACLSPVFVSQFGSTSVEYLQKLFFNANPKAIQISTFSTDTTLRAKNLLRLLAIDTKVPEIFLRNVLAFGASKAVVVYQSGVYFEDLSRGIADAYRAAGITVLYIQQWDLAAITAFVGADKANFTFVVETPLVYVRQLKAAGLPNSFQFLMSDGAVPDVTSDAALLAYLEANQAQLIQPFFDEYQLALHAKYQAQFGTPAHPVSTNISLLFQGLDWAVLVLSTWISARLVRNDYLNLYLDEVVRASSSQNYAGYSYVPGSFAFDGKLYFLSDGTLYLGEQVSPSSSLEGEQGVSTRPPFLRKGCGKGICVLYDEADPEAERGPLVKQIIKKYVTDNGVCLEPGQLRYLGLTMEPGIDATRLTRAYREEGSSVFLSAFGSGPVKYLNTIFFSKHVETTIHINTRSTASSLSVYPNLARYQNTTDFFVKVYMFYIQQKLAGTGGNVIICIDYGVYAADLSRELKEAAVSAGFPTQVILRDEMTDQWLLDNTAQTFVLAVIYPDAMSVARQLMGIPGLGAKSYQILNSDSTTLSLPATADELDFLESHQALAIQQYVSPRQLAIYEQYQNAIGSATHPVTNVVAFLLASFDWSLLVTGTSLSHRLTRRAYQTLLLSPELDGLISTFGGFSYGLQKLIFSSYWFVYQGITYRGVPAS